MEHLSLNDETAGVDHAKQSVSAPTQPFRFLDLPTELRLMVYEAIEVESHDEHATIRPYRYDGPQKISRTYLTISPFILATCRQIRFEARPILAPRIGLVKNQPVRFHMPTYAAPEFVHPQSLLSACFDLSEFNVEDKAAEFAEAKATKKRCWLYAQKAEQQSRDPGKELVKIPAEMRTLQGFMERSARAIWVNWERPLTKVRTHDVEIVLGEHIGATQYFGWSEFHWNLERLARDADISIVVKMTQGDEYSA